MLSDPTVWAWLADNQSGSPWWPTSTIQSANNGHMSFRTEPQRNKNQDESLIWQITFYFPSHGWLDACVSFTWGIYETRKHYGKKVNQWRQSDRLVNVLLGKVVSCHSFGCYSDNSDHHLLNNCCRPHTSLRCWLLIPRGDVLEKHDQLMEVPPPNLQDILLITSWLHNTPSGVDRIPCLNELLWQPKGDKLFCRWLRSYVGLVFVPLQHAASTSCLYSFLCVSEPPQHLRLTLQMFKTENVRNNISACLTRGEIRI